MIQSSSSGRVKLNRTTIRKDSTALPKKRRSFGGTNLAKTATQRTPDNLTLNTSVENTIPESIGENTNVLELSSINIPNDYKKQSTEEKTNGFELSSINIQVDGERQICPTFSELNKVNASPPKSTKVELQQAPEEDKETSNQAEGLSKGTEQPLDPNLPCELRRRGADPGKSTSGFGDIHERAGGPNTRSKSSSGKTSFKACQLEKMKSERVKRHRKQVCCRLALCIFGKDSDKIGVSKKEHSIQTRAKFKTGNVYVGYGNTRGNRKEKRRVGKASLVRAEHTQSIRGTGVKAKNRQSKRLTFQRKRHRKVHNNGTAYMNTTTQRPSCLVADGSSKSRAVNKRRQTASSVKKGKAQDILCLCVRQRTKKGCHSGKIAQVRSSRHVVGTAKTDAKSTHYMTLRRRKSGRVTENWIYKVPAKKPNTEGNSAFRPNSHQILCDHSGENNNKRLIKSPCCTTCCDFKYLPPRIYSAAKLQSHKPSKTPAKNPIEQGLKKWEPGVGYNPFVNLCDILKVSKVLADQLDSTYVINEELKQKPIRCFKRDHGDLIHLDNQDGPCTSGEARQSQEISNQYTAHMIGQSAKNAPKVVNGAFPVVGLAEIVDNQSHAIETQPGKRMRLSTEIIGSTPHDSEIFREPDTAIQMGCSTTASTSHEKRPLSNTMLHCSTGPGHKSENCKHKDAVQGNISPVVSRIVMVGAEESGHPGESCTDDSVDGETEDENERPNFSSCQRTTPSQVWARPSCARVYISWPFRERLSSTNGWDVSVTSLSVSVPSSANTASLVTLSASPLYNSSVTDTPGSQNASHSCEAADSSPLQGEASDFRDGSEHLRASETNGSISEKHCVSESLSLVNGSGVSAQITLVLQHSGQSAEVVELQQDPKLCSSATDYSSKFVQEQGTCREANLEPQVCESDHLRRQKLLQTKAPPKPSSKSVNQAKSPNGLNFPAPCAPLNGTTKSPHFSSTWKRYIMPSGLAQGEHPRCVSQAQNLRARLEVSTALAQGSSGDDASSMSSDDDLMNEVLAPCGEIMCEIRDTGQSYRCSAPVEEGPSGGTIDLLKAYEQDAIVLDVIQDDPELFGNVPEVVPVVKSETPLASKVIHPAKTYVVKNNHKITWEDAQLSATGSDDLGQQDSRKRVCRSILPIEIDGYSNGDLPMLNGLAGGGFHTESSLPVQKGTTDSPQSSVCEWLWPDFKTSFQGGARLNSGKASACTSDDVWDAGLDGDPVQTNVIKDLSAQSAAWTAGSLSDLSEGSEMYCKFYFSEQYTCYRNVCWFLHLPVEGDEKFCMAAVQKLLSGKSSHLLRAAAVFTGYYRKCAPGVHFEMRTLKSLLSALFNQGIVKDQLSVLRVMTPYKILPPVEFISAMFERVSVWGLRIAVPDLIDVTAKCVEAGQVFTTENFEYMQGRLELLKTPSSQMEVFLNIKYRVRESSVAWTPEVGDLAMALAEVECCKEQQDWTKLGGVFCSVCTSNPSLDELNHLCGRIAMVLLIDTPPTSPLPFCQFVEAVCQGASVGGLVKSLLGRIGVSLLLRYYQTQQWTKGTKLLDALNALKVNYSTLKGLFAGDGSVSRCRVISIAAEVLLGCGSMESALSVLKDNEWILSSPLWQCEEADVVHRHSVLCRLAECATQKSMFEETLEILTNLPDVQDVKVDPAQYNLVFHLHLKACLEKPNLTVASNIAELMFTKKIEVDMCVLQLLIHKLGKQNAWQKARILYRSALSMGCYPQTQMNKYCRILPIPHSLSEVEMTLALEMFMVSNATDIQNPGFFPHALQIVLKWKGGTELVSETDRHAAISRLLSAAQTANPKLVIKYATVNLNQEQVFTLDSISACKWLSRNLDWASKLWLPSDSKPESKISPQALST
ncbi:uncharacterized protein topaz1 isoform X1 [Anguilla anguilla]|uniref:uncharacterized protein topaz1 isoform X1 n=2 Tax=Anguilla anguilla TaxID=7936 RepID=UPI0015AB7129|nr:uncharacterized protein topaz1 isoform X1 [Anguilla anguilla]